MNIRWRDRFAYRGLPDGLSRKDERDDFIFYTLTAVSVLFWAVCLMEAK